MKFGFNEIIDFINGSSCSSTYNVTNIYISEVREISTNDISCVGQIIEYDSLNNIAYLGVPVISLINLLKVLFILIFLMYPTNILLKIFEINLNFYKFLDNKNYFLYFIFYIFILNRYLNLVLTNSDYLVSLNFTLIEFILFNVSYVILFVLILQLPKISKNVIYNYIILLILVTIPIFNYFNLYSNSYLSLILIFNIFVLRIFKSSSFGKINLALLIISLLTTLQLLITISLTFENKGWVSEVHELFKTKESVLFSDFDNQIQNLNPSNNPPVIVFWFDELPSLVINSETGVRKNFPNLNKFSEQSYNFLRNNSNSSYSAYAIEELFNKNTIKTISSNYIFKTVEPFSNICNFQFCDFQLQEFNREKIKINYFDILAIYLNFFSLDLYSEYIPDIYTVTSNFWKNNESYDISGDSSIYFDYESTKFLLNNIQNNEFLFTHLIFPHMPWEYSKEGVMYIDSNKAITSNFLVEPNKPGALNWNQVYKENIYYQNIEVARLIEQTIFMDQIFGEYIDILKKNNLFEKSLIIFTSDHGINFNPEENSRGANENNLEVYHTPLLLKLPYQNEAYQIKENTSHSLIIETIEDLILNIPLTKTIESHLPDTRVKIFERDTFKQEINSNYYEFPLEAFNEQINFKNTFYVNSYKFYEDNFDWKYINLNTKDFTDITKRVTIKNLKENTPKKYFYLTLETKASITNSIYVISNNSVLLLPDSVISKDSFEFTILLEKPMTYDEILNIKFFTNN